VYGNSPGGFRDSVKHLQSLPCFWVLLR